MLSPDLASAADSSGRGANLGWSGFIRVDGETYNWMGDPKPFQTLVEQESFEYTSTRSRFNLRAGRVTMIVTFLSPINPNDLKRQSLPFTYVNVEVSSRDGRSHDVQLYTDITAEWVSGNRTTVSEWDYGVVQGDNPRGVAYHTFHRQNQLIWSETTEQTDYGSWFWATDNVANLTYQSGADLDIRRAFIGKGFLPNTKDTHFRAINDNFPTFGFAKSLGSVSSTPISTLFTLGLAQEQSIQFDGAKGISDLNSLWTSYFPQADAALAFFHNDYATAANLATDFDNKVAADAKAAGGEDYVTITSLGARQAFAGTQLAGTAQEPFLFLKEISSDGNVQTVDVIFPFHPILLYTNPTLLKILLDPLFINQESGHYPNQYSMHDLGSHFPKATGHPDGKDEQEPLEECGNMLIMTLAYAQRANDFAYLRQHYKILDQWTQYLIKEALIPANQISTDDFAGPLANQTNLALKGIIGIEAMAVIAKLTGNNATAANYTNISHSYAEKWQNLAIAHDANPPHTTLSYGMGDTHGMLYNLYADRELSLNLLPRAIYDMQSNFYATQFSDFGVPLDTRHTYTKNDWAMFCAAIAGTDTKNRFISTLVNWVRRTPTNRAATDLYETKGGDFPNGLGFMARPVVGGWFALLALT